MDVETALGLGVECKLNGEIDGDGERVSRRGQNSVECMGGGDECIV